jgi:hypothetical protein
MTPSQMYEAATAEGLTLVRAYNECGYKGVICKHNKFLARVRKGGRQRQLGTFASAEEAALAYARHVATDAQAEVEVEVGARAERGAVDEAGASADESVDDSGDSEWDGSDCEESSSDGGSNYDGAGGDARMRPYADEVVGRRVTLWWPAENQWFEGTVASFVRGRRLHLIQCVHTFALHIAHVMRTPLPAGTHATALTLTHAHVAHTRMMHTCGTVSARQVRRRR